MVKRHRLGARLGFWIKLKENQVRLKAFLIRLEPSVHSIFQFFKGTAQGAGRDGNGGIERPVVSTHHKAFESTLLAFDQGLRFFDPNTDIMLAQDAALVDSVYVCPWNEPCAHRAGVIRKARIVDGEARRSVAQIPDDEDRCRNNSGNAYAGDGVKHKSRSGKQLVKLLRRFFQDFNGAE